MCPGYILFCKKHMGSLFMIYKLFIYGIILKIKLRGCSRGLHFVTTTQKIYRDVRVPRSSARYWQDRRKPRVEYMRWQYCSVKR